METNIKCKCGAVFRGWKSKEDTCSKCLKDLINSTKKYNVIYADPPWHYSSKEYQDGNRDMKNLTEQYSTMSINEIKKLPINNICEKDAICFMWVTDSHLKEGIEVLESWGFKYKTIAFNWIKKTSIGNTYVNFAPWTLKSSEICLLGIKGIMGKYKQSNNVRQLIEAERTKHSKKPHEARLRIESLFGDLPKVELFAREKVIGWDSWGDEIQNDIELTKTTHNEGYTNK